MSSLLEAAGLSKRYIVGSRLARGGRREVQALDDVSLSVQPRETLGLVGESGCGKSTLGRVLLRLIEPSAGRVSFEGREITHISERAMRPIRARMQMVFQDPYASLNPRRRIGDLISEPLRVHGRGGWREISERTAALVDLVGLSQEHLVRFPHEFSGGQRQRIGIARALALEPRLIVADEPVSALDVSVQAQIVNLFADLQERLGLTYVFIAHDLSVVRQISTRVAVMYLGSIVETGLTDAVLHSPSHPYTAALISSVPTPDAAGVRRNRIALRGEPPSPSNPPSGCRFHTRCPNAETKCSEIRPFLVENAPNHFVACHYPLA
jgi:peptide/nickel transport system ATP-binding protein